MWYRYRRKLIFQSTPPARGATSKANLLYWYIKISIHAPREGGDEELEEKIEAYFTISIHAPARGVTYVALMEIGSIIISIHAPARGVTELQEQH